MVRAASSAMLTGRALRLFLVGSVAWLGAYPWLPTAMKPAAFLIPALAAVPAAAVGLHSVQPGKRLPWWLLVTALLVLNLGLLLRISDPGGEAIGVLLNAVGNLLILAASVALIVRCGRTDVGGVIDASIFGLAFGGILSIVIFAVMDVTYGVERMNLVIVLFALSGVLGALIRVATTLTEAVAALPWLMLALAFALTANLLQASSAAPSDVANLLFMATYTSVGAFGLHPTAPRLVRPGFVNRDDQLSVTRLVFLGVAIAAIPTVVGVLILLRRSTVRDGAVLLVGAAATAALVMVRIGRLSADRSHVESVLRKQATVDSLTGLANRQTLLDRLTAALGDQIRCAVLFCDLDGFKSVNDAWGHGIGDELLADVGLRLQSCVRETDTVSRFGGDEFLILLVDASQASTDTIVARIRVALAAPFHLASGDLTIGISIGVAISATGTADELIRAADHDMYHAKRTRSPTPSPRIIT